MRKFCSYCHREYFADELGDCPFCGSHNYDDDENFCGFVHFDDVTFPALNPILEIDDDVPF